MNRAILVLYGLLVAQWPNSVTSSTHWVVTEEGKIQAQVDSIFHMKRPYDLVSLLEQERRVSALEGVKEQIQGQGNLQDVVSKHEPDLSAKFFSRDPDCQAAGQPLTEFDLFVSTLIHPDPGVVEEVVHILRPDEHDSLFQYDEPFCTPAKPHHFDLELIDDLSSTVKREVLQMPGELGLMANVLDHGRFHLPQYGHLVALSIQSQKPHNWLATLLAANYWRINGNANEAVGCLRKAIYYAPREFKHLGLLSLANVYHRTHNSQDAVEVLKKAIEYSPDNPALHFTLGNVHATLIQFNESASSYDEALKLHPLFTAAKLRRHAVLCHYKLELALEEQHKSLSATLRELRQYKKQHETWTTLLSKILGEQATAEVRMEARMGYEQFKIQQSRDGRGQDCIQHQQMGHTYLTCSLHTEKDRHKDLWSAGSHYHEEDAASQQKADLEHLLKTFEDRVESIGIETEDSNKKKHNEELEEITREPSLPPKYASWPQEEVDMPHLDPEWPSANDCVTQISKPPQWNEYPSVFLSPENKGFDIAKLMSSDIELPLEHEAPLPWYPPFCKRYEGTIAKYDKLHSIERWSHINIKSPEREIEAAYHLHSPEKNFHEWGARVTAAMKSNVSPKWVVNLLAGTYWRIWGHPQNAIHCYRHALSSVPPMYKDVVLTNLAGLLYKTGTVDDALTVMKDSLEVDDKDPVSNFFIANLYSAKGNMTGAIHHYRRALKMDPQYRAAFQFLHVPACHVKFKSSRPVQTKPKDCSKDNSADCLDTNSFTQIDGRDNLILCKDGRCKFVSPTEFLAQASKATQVLSDDSKTVSSSGAKKKKNKKKRRKKAKDEVEEEIIRPKEGEDTVLLDREQMKHGLPQGAVEIGTIAETEPDDEYVDAEDEEVDKDDLQMMVPDDEVSNNVIEAAVKKKDKKEFIGPTHLVDDPLPDVLIRVREKLASPQPTEEECEEAKEVNWAAFTSTWLSVSAKNIDIREFLGDYLEPLPRGVSKKPFCDEVPTSLLALDHLTGVRMRQHLHVASEAGLKEAFRGLTGHVVPVETMATRISLEMEKNSTSWVLSTAAALYWRVKGQAEQAVQCLRHALYHAPRQMKDIPLISLANILHRSGMYNDALIATNMALEISPKFVVIHFTMASIYVSKNELEMAVSFYHSTLALQSTFEPARDRLLSIQCSDNYKQKHPRKKPTIDEDFLYYVIGVLLSRIKRI